MRFQAPQLGALGVTFTGLRLLQFVSLISIIGLLANFIDEIVSSQHAVPDVMIGTITVSSVAVLYVIISYILYYDGLLPLLIAVGTDLAMLIAFTVAAATTGKPMSGLSCERLPAKAGGTQTQQQQFSISVPDITVSYARAVASGEKPMANYLAFISQDQPHCMEVKAVWGLSIAACCSFAISALVCAGLWRRVKGSSQQASFKDVEASG